MRFSSCLLFFAASAASCLVKIDDDELPPKLDGGGETGLCQGECCPTEAYCYPGGDNTAPGYECLATRDNRGQDRVQLRTVWTRTIFPAANTDVVTYSFLLDQTVMPLEGCNLHGNSGYIQMFDWDRSSAVLTDQIARVGYAAYVPMGEGITAINDGLCFVEMLYSDPEHGWTEEVPVGPSITRRVEQDFDIHDATFRATYKDAEEGAFYVNEVDGTVHGYAPRAHLVIYEGPDQLFVVPAREAEVVGQFNDPESLNCQGRFRTDVLELANECEGPDQEHPPYGCVDDECEEGRGPVTTTAYFLIEELEMVHVTLLNTSLCVSYMGQATAIEEGWADPATWGLNCSGSPRWQAGERPRGDWCSETNGPATDECADAWKSESSSAAAATNIQIDTCTTDVR